MAKRRPFRRTPEHDVDLVSEETPAPAPVTPKPPKVSDRDKLIAWASTTIYPHPRCFTPEQIADKILHVLGRAS
jgi:hypothetical protein